LKPFVRGGEGPSSTIQSLRSMRDVLWPKFGGEGEGDVGGDCREVIGAKKEVSLLKCDFLDTGANVEDDNDDEGKDGAAPRDSNVDILDCRAAEGMELEGSGRGLRNKSGNKIT
jgi:hypothetical protein